MKHVSLDELPHSLAASLASIQGARLNGVSQERVSGKQPRPGVIVNITIGKRELYFVVELRSDVYPRDAREVLSRLKQRRQELNASSRRYIPMLLAKSISDGARMFLQEEKIAYHDLSGSLHINTRGIFILLEKPKPRWVRRHVSKAFRRTRAQVLHALFSRPDEWVSGTEIAESADVSPATVSETFKYLERQEWLEVKGKGPAKRRRLMKPSALLDAWRDGLSAGDGSKRDRYFVPSMKPEDMAREIAKATLEEDIDLEFTGQFAAQIYTPFLSTVYVLTVRVGGRRVYDRLLSMLDARRVSMGSNLVVIDAHGYELSRRKRVDEENPLLASPLQVYLDLLEDHGRSPEMAAHLRKHKLAL